MGDALGLILSIYDASEKLYHFYQVAKDRDNDIANLRVRLLELQEKCVLVKMALERDGMQMEDQSEVKQALKRCDQQVERIEDRLRDFPSESSDSSKFSMKLKSWFLGVSRKARWPFQRSTIVAFSADVTACHSAVDEAIKLLHLNVSGRTIKELRELDRKITNSIITSDKAMEGFRSDVEDAVRQVSEQVAKQNKLMSDRTSDEEVDRLLDSLRDPDFQRRQGAIVDSHDKTYDFFTAGAQEFPQAVNLLRFLETGTSIF